MSLTVRCFGSTDQGRKRSTNQDHYLTARLNKSMVVRQSSIATDQHARFVSQAEGHLLLVADGMGGHAGGEVASQLAIDSAVAYVLNSIPWFHRLSQDCDDDFRDELKRALEFCQQQLERQADAEPNHRDMGTTLTMAYIIGEHLYVAHVGDSRCYLWRNGELHQVTRDHTLAQSLADEGQLSVSNVADSPLSHVLWNAVGGSAHSDLRPDVYSSELMAGDQVVLCTDGLTRHIDDASINEMLCRDIDLERKCEEFIAGANREGGSDNITVVLAHIEKAEVELSGPETTSTSDEHLRKDLADTDPYFGMPPCVAH